MGSVSPCVAADEDEIRSIAKGLNHTFTGKNCWSGQPISTYMSVKAPCLICKGKEVITQLDSCSLSHTHTGPLAAVPVQSMRWLIVMNGWARTFPGVFLSPALIKHLVR